MRRKRYRGQGIIEYAVLVASFIAAVIAMQIYIKRGISGRWKQAMDDLGPQFSATQSRAYITYRQKSTLESTTKMEERDDGRLTAVTETTIGPNEERHYGYERVERINREDLFE